SKNTGRIFVVDTRIRADVTLVGIEISKLTYADLLAILQVHSFVAVEGGNLIRILPDSQARLTAPFVTDNNEHANAEYVTKVIHLKSVSTPFLVPILRSLLPQNAHLAAFG